MKTYPVFALLEGVRVLVVGGGEVAERKAAALIDAGALVQVVAREACEAMRTLETRGELKIELRDYRAGEAAGYALTVASTDDAETNRQVADDSRGAGRLVNVVDQPDLCNFIVPSVIRKGELTIAISTGGASPALSRRIRERLEKEFPESMSQLIEVLGEFRARIMNTRRSFEERKKIMTDVVNSPEVDAFLSGDEGPLKELLAKWI